MAGGGRDDKAGARAGEGDGIVSVSVDPGGRRMQRIPPRSGKMVLSWPPAKHTPTRSGGRFDQTAPIDRWIRN